MGHSWCCQSCSCRAASPVWFMMSMCALPGAWRVIHRKGADVTLLTVEGITKRFGGLLAVHDLSLSVEPGQIVALIGPNGAGKTTAFNVISGVYKADAGQVVFNGRNITALRPDQICKLGLTRTFQVV